MDLAGFKATLEKYGKDKVLQIIFDNSRVWLINRPKPDPNKPSYPLRDANGKVVFYTFDELVTIDEDTESIVYRESQHGTDVKTANKVQWDIVTPIDMVQGLNVVPAEFTPEQEYELRMSWDVTIV